MTQRVQGTYRTTIHFPSEAAVPAAHRLAGELASLAFGKIIGEPDIGASARAVGEIVGPRRASARHRRGSRICHLSCRLLYAARHHRASMGNAACPDLDGPDAMGFRLDRVRNDAALAPHSVSRPSYS